MFWEFTVTPENSHTNHLNHGITAVLTSAYVNLDALFLLFLLLQHKYGNLVKISVMFTIFNIATKVDAAFFVFIIASQMQSFGLSISAVFIIAAQMLSFTCNISVVCHFHYCNKKDKLDAVFLQFSLSQHKCYNLLAIFLQFAIFDFIVDSVFLQFSLLQQKC